MFAVVRKHQIQQCPLSFFYSSLHFSLFLIFMTYLCCFMCRILWCIECAYTRHTPNSVVWFGLFWFGLAQFTSFSVDSHSSTLTNISCHWLEKLSRQCGSESGIVVIVIVFAVIIILWYFKYAIKSNGSNNKQQKWHKQNEIASLIL